MASEEQKQSESESIQNQSSIFSPRFKSVAAMAGWDEETLLSASLIVDDTPDRELNQKKRVVLQFKTPPSSDSRKKRRVQRSPVPIVALDLNEAGATKNETKKDEKEEKKESKWDLSAKKNVAVSGSSASLLCMDKLREELACAICLDVCFEPSTTPCGHSFCLKCLRLAASKCEKKCPKCRQLIGNGRSCTVNTVLWNTIQLLFPEEVEAKKAAGALNSREAKDRKKIPESAFYDSLRNESPRDSEILQVEETTTSRRRRVSRSQSEEDDPIAGLLREIRSINRASRASSRRTPTQDEDAAMALRLQREEVVRSTNTTRLNNRSSSSAYNRSVSLASNSETTSDQSRGRGRSRSSSSSSSFSLARENLRAMASIASNRVRSWNF